MSSGGMDWAYRMIAAHNLDPLGVAVVLHLGWRDAANQRTDSGIARALAQHRSSIRLATSKLEAAGLICRRSGQWVAVETVQIVTDSSEARRPDAASSDRDRPVSGHGQSLASPRPVSGHRNGQSVATMRKEKLDKGAKARSPVRPPRRLPLESGGAALDPARLTPFQRSCVLADQSVQVAGDLIAAGSPQMRALRSALRGVRRDGPATAATVSTVGAAGSMLGKPEVAHVA